MQGERWGSHYSQTPAGQEPGNLSPRTEFLVGVVPSPASATQHTVFSGGENGSLEEARGLQQAAQGLSKD